MPINLLRTVGKIPLDRIDTTGATGGQVPTYDLASNKLVWGEGGGSFEVVGDPMQGQVPKWNQTSMQWEPGDDLTTGGGMSDGVVTAATFDASTAGTVSVSLARSEGLNAVTASFSVFDGDYTSLANRPVLFSGAYGDLSSKPTIPTIPDPVYGWACSHRHRHDGG